jgi:hypothetical protein
VIVVMSMAVRMAVIIVRMVMIVMRVVVPR